VPVRIVFDGNPSKPMIAGLSVTATVYSTSPPRNSGRGDHADNSPTHVLPRGNEPSSPSA